jgi:hypothetical protein
VNRPNSGSDSDEHHGQRKHYDTTRFHGSDLPAQTPPNAQFSRRAGHLALTAPKTHMAGPVGCNASFGYLAAF